MADTCRAIVWPCGPSQRQAEALWLEQTLGWSACEHGEWGTCFFEQQGNGPCGALAAVQAHLLSVLAAAGEACSSGLDAVLVEALARMIEQCQTCTTTPVSHLVVPAEYGGGGGDSDSAHQGAGTEPSEAYAVCSFHSPAGLRRGLTSHLQSFQRRGGLVQLIYTLVLTRGVDRVTQEVRCAHPAEDSLVAADTYGCGQLGFGTVPLLTLMVSGAADGRLDFHCTDAVSRKQDSRPPGSAPPPPPSIGILGDDPDSLFVVGPWLRSPLSQVWIVRSPAHYTTVWVHAREGPRVSVCHFNALAQVVSHAEVEVRREVSEVSPPGATGRGSTGDDVVAADTTSFRPLAPLMTQAALVRHFISKRPGGAGVTEETQFHVFLADTITTRLTPPAYTAPDIFLHCEQAGRNWYCASCYCRQHGPVQMAPNWNAPDAVVCGACHIEPFDLLTDRSRWVGWTALSPADQSAARKKWPSEWQELAKAVCVGAGFATPASLVSITHSTAIHLH